MTTETTTTSGSPIAIYNCSLKIEAGYKSALIALPCFGEPYIHSFSKSKDGDLKKLKDVVGGAIEPYDRKDFVIHPLFASESKRWALIPQLLKQKTIKVYVNENGFNLCGPNMATIITNASKRLGGCPHLLGEIGILVPLTVLSRLRINPDVLTIAEDGGEKLDEVEPEDEEDEERLKERFATKGWDYKEEHGRVYVKAP